MITESEIKAAVRAAVARKPRTELHDGGARGAGRLVLVIGGKGTSAAPSAEFFAAWYRDGRRVMSKLGFLPSISLADARKRLSVRGDSRTGAKFRDLARRFAN